MQTVLDQREELPEIDMAAVRAEYAALAAKTFPNNAGNYTGKRKPAAPTLAITPTERFARLAGTFEAYARSYRSKRTPQPTSDRGWLAEMFANLMGAAAGKIKLVRT